MKEPTRDVVWMLTEKSEILLIMPPYIKGMFHSSLFRRHISILARYPLLPRCASRGPIEPKWVHAKRNVVEHDGLLTARQLAERVCAYFGCSYESHLSIPEKVA